MTRHDTIADANAGTRAAATAAFRGRSDYQAFINNGIPAGGLFTGAEQPKTAAEVVLWGGRGGRGGPASRTTRATTRPATGANIDETALDIHTKKIDGLRSRDWEDMQRVNASLLEIA